MGTTRLQLHGYVNFRLAQNVQVRNRVAPLPRFGCGVYLTASRPLGAGAAFRESLDTRLCFEPVPEHPYGDGGKACGGPAAVRGLTRVRGVFAGLIPLATGRGAAAGC